jgi:prepilin-type N-terminal cleavage/methylation domain-containing protein
MKTMKEMRIADCGLRIQKRETVPRPNSLRAPRSALRTSRAFTLIELLVVIAIMGVLAALLFPVVGAVKKHQYINHAQAEMARLETAIERYKAAYGFYPPDNPGNPLTNQLYYELVGTTNINDNNHPPIPPPSSFKTLDGSLQIDSVQLNTAFSSGVSGFMNCSKCASSGEDTPFAKNFLPELKPDQLGTIKVGTVWVTNLISSAGGPYAQYQPLGQQDVNPWRYNSSNPTNNPGSYELWIQLVFAPGQTNLICNWTKQVQINSPLP